jgi:hypothetical protein
MTDGGIATYRKVLVMVLELHLRGFQCLRIEPAISPSGMHWRCAVAPASLFSERHGARLSAEAGSSKHPLVARYTTGEGVRFCGWRDLHPSTTPSGLANRFAARFPDIVRAGHGSDWAYSGWYVEMLHLTYPSLLPYALADWDTPDDYLPVTGDPDESMRIPLPPPAWDGHTTGRN